MRSSNLHHRPHAIIHPLGPYHPDTNNGNAVVQTLCAASTEAYNASRDHKMSYTSALANIGAWKRLQITCNTVALTILTRWTDATCMTEISATATAASFHARTPTLLLDLKKQAS